MKLRIKSHSVRFRITSEELAELTQQGRVVCVTHIPQSGGEVATFTHEVVREPLREASDLVVTALRFTLILNEADFAELSSGSGHAVYIRREWTNDEGRSIRFVVYIEADHKKHKSEKHDKAGKHSTGRDLGGSAGNDRYVSSTEVNEA